MTDVTNPAETQAPETIQANVAARKVFEELIEMAGEACNEASHPNFQNHLWTLLRDHAISNVGLPAKAEEKIKPLEDKVAKEFSKDVMPRGKYVDESIEKVFTEDAAYLRGFASSLEWFQVKLKQWLAWKDQQSAMAAEKAKLKAKKEAEKAKAPPKEKEKVPDGSVTT